MQKTTRCPNCEHPSPVDASVCYCGYDFALQDMAPNHQVRMSFPKIWWSFDGRIDRTTFLIVGALTNGIFHSFWWSCFFLAVLGQETFTRTIIALVIWMAVYALMGVWPGFALVTKRLHDTNRPGKMSLVGLVPVANLWLTVCMLLPGTRGPNDYGPQP